MAFNNRSINLSVGLPPVGLAFLAPVLFVPFPVEDDADLEEDLEADGSSSIKIDFSFLSILIFQYSDIEEVKNNKVPLNMRE